jgi:hypothetical protein
MTNTGSSGTERWSLVLAVERPGAQTTYAHLLGLDEAPTEVAKLAEDATWSLLAHRGDAQIGGATGTTVTSGTGNRWTPPAPDLLHQMGVVEGPPPGAVIAAPADETGPAQPS